MHVFRFKDVIVRRQDVDIISGLTVDFEPGLFYTIYGPSGSGKSTLLRLFNLMTIPTQGQIRFWDNDVFSFNILALRRRVSLVMQEPISFEGSVADNIRLPLLFNRRKPDVSVEEKIEQVLDSCQLEKSFLTRNAMQLSGGEKQRMAIARALMNFPEVLLLDEPTSALDLVLAERLMRRLRQMFPLLTLIVVTHSPELIEMSERKIELASGTILNVFQQLDRIALLKRLEMIESAGKR
ncbi:ATP-binding cassette domain-containing protein [bacterium]|nr:ATP-binding cassette domain-containing protein [bacterium]